jgi:NADH-quinone oxidoreductase subunit L
MTDVQTLLIVIVALPLAAALLTAVLGRRVLGGQSHWPTIAAIALSFLASLTLVFQLQQPMTQPVVRPEAATVVTLWMWCHAAGAAPQSEGNDSAAPCGGDFRVDVALRADPLSAVMLAVVTCIAALVAIYSIGYMRGDPGYWRFFAYVSLFVFSMTLLVAADNFAVLYVGWELVGLCSYLLIGFWYDKPAAAAAGKKAFLVNRIGDAGLMLGIFLIWTTYGTLDFDGVFAAVGRAGGGTATAIGLLLLLGACGKSAQFPLHVWLPDAMEGPTPVSALIHAATMVTAGVYLVARCMPLYSMSVDAQTVMAIVGGGTALLGAMIALAETDLKRILAYSTISHLGYMFAAMSVCTLAGVTAGMFHLVTHAFFKSLLFLGAGSVMHATGGVTDIRRLGGLRRRLPVTYWTFLVGCLAIAGVVPLAGFWSKDAILLAIEEHARRGGGEVYTLLLAVTLFGVLLIDFYMFRPFFLIFHGPERTETEGRVHESPGVMTAPMVMLALGAATVGGYLAWTHGLADFLASMPSLAGLARPAGDAAEHRRMGIVSTAITLVGIAAAAAVYLGRPGKAQRLARAMNVLGLYGLARGQFFVDAIYAALVVRPLAGVARLAAWCDRRVIDAVVDFCGRLPALAGAAMRPVQNGLVQFYALAMALGLLALLGVLLL